MGNGVEGNPAEGAGNSIPEYEAILARAADAPRQWPIPRKVTRKHLEQAFLTSFELIGGVPRLALWADKNPAQFYTLLSKLFPQHIESKLSADESLSAILTKMGNAGPRPGPATLDMTEAQIISETTRSDSSAEEHPPLLEVDAGSNPVQSATDTMVHTHA